VGGSSAGLFLLADAESVVTQFVSVFVSVYLLLIFAYVLLSWVRLPYSPTMERVKRFLYETCDPYLRLFRRFVPPLGSLDISPIVAMLALFIFGRVVNALVERLLS
jgi:uncharacterized protein YggT (Ycf19 family)